MKFLKTGLSLVLLTAGIAAVPGSLTATASPAAAKKDDPALVAQMRSDASGTMRTSSERATGKLSFVRATGSGADLMPTLPGADKGDALTKADAYLDEYATAFGATPDQLVRVGTDANQYGRTVTYVQRYEGLPVFGAELRAHLSPTGELTSVNGELVPVGSVSTDTAITAADAGARAVELVKAQPPVSEDGKTHLDGVAAKTTTLVVYKSGLVQGLSTGATGLVYQVEVTNGTTVRDMVFVSAVTGKVVNRYSMMADALERELYEESPDSEPVFVEGDPFPGTLNEDQQNLVNSTGEIYWLYKNTFNRDSYTGEGTTMKTVNNDPRINCPNANWNGTTANYCDGVTSDDVVAHEWTHAYTEYTHGLIYQWQSGALNEGYSDIFGETLDLLNDREDDGEGDINKIRPVGLCSSHSPANPLVTINAPSDIAKDCLTGGAAYGPQLDGEGITSDVVAGLDEANPGGPTVNDGCTAYTNAAEVAGKVALVNRGTCPFTDKTLRAQEAGAIAVIIGNNDDSTISPSGTGSQYTIPTVTIGLTDRTSIYTSLTEGDTVNVTMKDASGDRFDSYRWLIGEKSPAFGGAIRDMWNPTCYGDPGKVSDVEYKCSTADNGGVHGNSGVVNHGYALLVDGGEFNGVDVTGIGIDKALNIYYRAMTEYQTPVSNFVDHADSLLASCTDLVNRQIKRVEIGGPGGSSNPVVSKKKITAEDCAQVAAMSDAVELRLDPTEQCAWVPMFTPGSGEPSACGDDTGARALLAEDFESGLDDWELTSENPYNGLTDEWEIVNEQDYLGNHTGSVAYGPAPDKGTCDGSTQDFSSVDYMTSPVIDVPEGATSPRMSWEHSVATEVGFDGGTVQVAVDGGDWETIPAEAYTFNGPGQIATVAEQNTNPLAGEPGFTGTDPNKSFSEWGTSQVDLSLLATPVAAGQSVQVRYAIGRDGCGGNEGWFVDNVNLVVCLEKTATEITTVARTPEPTTYGTASTVAVSLADGTETGTVTVKKGAQTLGTAEVTDGEATVSLPADLAVGGYDLTVDYSGDDTFAAASDTLAVVVSKAASTTTVTKAPAQVKKGKTATIRVRVSGPASPSGNVVLRAGDRWLGKASVSGGGVVVITTRPLRELGNVTITATFNGPNHATSKDTVKVKVVKASKKKKG